MTCPATISTGDTSAIRVFMRDPQLAGAGPGTMRVRATDGTDTIPLPDAMVVLRFFSSLQASAPDTQATDGSGVARMARSRADSATLLVRGFAMHPLRVALPTSPERIDSLHVFLRINPVAVCEYRTIRPASG